jgi:hypothetical protein
MAITGFDGGAARRAAEVSVHVECTNYGVIEDLDVYREVTERRRHRQE